MMSIIFLHLKHGHSDLVTSSYSLIIVWNIYGSYILIVSFYFHFRSRPCFDADCLQAASSLLSLGHMYSPISIATNEPDFNKAIASIIWSRHHGQATCTIFNCGVANCPLCPPTAPRDSVTPRPTEVKRCDSPKTTSRKSSVVNWLISSTSTSTTTESRMTRDKPRTNACSPDSYDRLQVAVDSYRHACPTPPSSTGSGFSGDVDSYTHVTIGTTESPTSDNRDEIRVKRRRLDDSGSGDERATSASPLAVITPMFRPTVDHENPFTCHFCPKRFAQASNCLSHLRTHTGDRPFKCPSCPKSFAQRTSLRTHLRTHTGDRPYLCVDCNQRFGDLSTLTKHRRTHTGEKPYRCHHAGCGKAFAQSGNLKRHFRTHDLDKKLVNFSA